MHGQQVHLKVLRSETDQGQVPKAFARYWDNPQAARSNIEISIDTLAKSSLMAMATTTNNILEHADRIQRPLNAKNQIVGGALLMGANGLTVSEKTMLETVFGKTQLFAEKIKNLTLEWERILTLISSISNKASVVLKNFGSSESFAQEANRILVQATSDVTIQELENLENEMNRLIHLAEYEAIKARAAQLEQVLDPEGKDRAKVEAMNQASKKAETSETANDTTSIDALAISPRTRLFLYRHDIKTVEALVKWTESGLLGLHGIEVVSVNQIKAALKAKKLKLARTMTAYNKK